MIGWVGNTLDQVNPHLWADANYAGCSQSQRSTSGMHFAIRGSDTCFPIAAGSKRQGCMSTSTPEAEMVSGFSAMRSVGIQALELWEVLLSREDLVIKFHEDNQAMIKIIEAGNKKQNHATPASCPSDQHSMDDRTIS